MRTYIHSIGLSRGEVRSLIDIPSNEYFNVIVAKNLISEGFEKFIQDNRLLRIIALEALENTLSQYDEPPDRIDAVIFATSVNGMTSCTDKVSNCDLNLINLLAYCMKRTGITNAFPFIINQEPCVSAMAALVQAANLIRGRQYENVLVIVVDKVIKSSERISQSGTVIFSDMAASFIMSKKPSKWEVGHIITQYSSRVLSNPEMNVTGNNAAEFYIFLSSFYKKVVDNFGDIGVMKFFIFDNLGNDMQEFISYAFSIDSHRIFLGTRQQIGHAYSVDWLCNMLDFKRMHTDDNMFLVGVLNIGLSAAGFVELAYRPDLEQL